MFCSKCGREAIENDSFCRGCGNSLTYQEKTSIKNETCNDNLMSDRLENQDKATLSSVPSSNVELSMPSYYIKTMPLFLWAIIYLIVLFVFTLILGMVINPYSFQQLIPIQKISIQQTESAYKFMSLFPDWNYIDHKEVLSGKFTIVCLYKPGEEGEGIGYGNTLYAVGVCQKIDDSWKLLHLYELEQMLPWYPEFTDNDLIIRYIENSNIAFIALRLGTSGTSVPYTNLLELSISKDGECKKLDYNMDSDVMARIVKMNNQSLIVLNRWDIWATKYSIDNNNIVSEYVLASECLPPPTNGRENIYLYFTYNEATKKFKALQDSEIQAHVGDNIILIPENKQRSFEGYIYDSNYKKEQEPLGVPICNGSHLLYNFIELIDEGRYEIAIIKEYNDSDTEEVTVTVETVSNIADEKVIDNSGNDVSTSIDTIYRSNNEIEEGCVKPTFIIHVLPKS